MDLPVVVTNTEKSIGKFIAVRPKHQLYMLHIDLVESKLRKCLLDAVLTQFMIDIGNCRNEGELSLEEESGFPSERLISLHGRDVPHILQKMQPFPDIVVNLLLGLKSPGHKQVGPRQQAGRYSILKLIEDLLCGCNMLLFEVKKFQCYHDALIIYLMIVVLEIPIWLYAYLRVYRRTCGGYPVSSY